LENIRLDDAIPHMNFPRSKVVKQVGYEVPRLTPLLPSSVKALRRWHEHEPQGPTAFRNARKGIWDQYDLNRDFTKMLVEAAAGKGFTFKSMRNVGPTLRKRHKLPKEVSDAFLGHVDDATNKFYEDDVDETYLAELVDLIGKDYFDGEAVALARRPGNPSTTSPVATKRASNSLRLAASSAMPT